MTGPATTANKKVGVAAVSVAANVALIIVKVVVGVLMGSVAVISEAIHSGVDLLAAVIALLAVRASSQKADERHPYGHGKYENISGTVEALLIFGAAAWIIYEAVHKLIHPQEIEMAAWGAGVMLVSVIVNLVVGQRLFKVGKQTDSVALQADAWHHRTDVYTSAGVMDRRDDPARARPALAGPGGGHPGRAHDHEGRLGSHTGIGPGPLGRELA
jgi:cation diffusion facilitator family transporter